MAKGGTSKELAQGLEALRRETKLLHRTLSQNIADVKDEERKRPFVLVLIDPVKHQFCKELVDGTFAGGSNAASLLSKAVSDELAANHKEIAANPYDLVVRLFVCLADIVDNDAVSGLARVPGTFFTAFTKASPFHDCVITATAKSVHEKVCENLHLYMGNDQCRHVFFAASGVPRYHHALVPHRKSICKLSVVDGLNTAADVRKLGARLVSFPRVFVSKPEAPVPTHSQPRSITTVNSAQVGTVEAPAIRKTAVAVAKSPLAIANPKNGSPIVHPFHLLPMDPIEGRVPINLAKQRLDIQAQLPTPADVKAYRECIRTHESCLEFHLQGKCKTVECELCHGALASGVSSVLACKALGKPCSKGSGCRISNCINAHFCQQENCAEAGGRVRGCGLPETMHGLDPLVAHWVPADVSE